MNAQEQTAIESLLESCEAARSYLQDDSKSSRRRQANLDGLEKAIALGKLCGCKLVINFESMLQGTWNAQCVVVVGSSSCGYCIQRGDAEAASLGPYLLRSDRDLALSLGRRLADWDGIELLNWTTS